MHKTDLPHEEVVAKRFVLVDDDGETRAVLGTSTTDGSPYFQLQENELARIVASMDGPGVPQICILYESGQVAVNLKLARDGKVLIGAYTESGDTLFVGGGDQHGVTFQECGK